MNQIVISKSKLFFLNPITKGILCVLFVLIFSFLCKSWILSLALNLILLSIFIVMRENLKVLFLSLKKIWLLLLVVGLFQGFVGKSYDYFSALNAIFKVLGVYWTAIIYTSYSSQNELLYFWELCFKPLKLFGVSSSELALTMVIAIRFLPVFINEIERIKIAQIARGAKIKKTSIFSSINFMPLIIPILTQALMRSEELADAMEVRAYVPNRPRGRYKVYSFGRYDFLAFLVSSLILSTLIYYLI